MNIVVAYRGIPHAPGRETGAALARAFRRLGHSVYEYGNYYREARRINDSATPADADLLVYCECNDGDPQYEELRSLKVKQKIYWNFDIANNPVRTLLFVWRMGFDLVFYANKLYENSLKRICPRSFFLPYAIDDEFHRMIPTVKKTVDIGFVGNLYSARTAFIDGLERAGINVQTFSGVYGEDLVRLINSFKIHLNYNAVPGILVGRVWETTGCGALLLTQQEDFIDLFFESGKQIVTYRDQEECIAKARELLADDRKRETIAQEGYTMVHEHHTYVSRAKTILDSLSYPEVLDNKHSQALGAIWEIARTAIREGIRSKPVGV